MVQKRAERVPLRPLWPLLNVRADRVCGHSLVLIIRVNEPSVVGRGRVRLRDRASIRVAATQNLLATRAGSCRLLRAALHDLLVSADSRRASRPRRAGRANRSSVSLRALRSCRPLRSGVAGRPGRTSIPGRTGRPGGAQRTLNAGGAGRTGRTSVTSVALRSGVAGVAKRTLHSGRTSGADRPGRTRRTDLIPVQRFLGATAGLTECGVDDPQRAAGRVATVNDAPGVGNARVCDTTER